MGGRGVSRLFWCIRCGVGKDYDAMNFEDGDRIWHGSKTGAI